MNVSVQTFVLPGGKLQIFVDGDVNDEQAAAITKAVLGQLQAGGVSFESIGDVEFHRNGGSHVHVHNQAKQQATNS